MVRIFLILILGITIITAQPQSISKTLSNKLDSIITSLAVKYDIPGVSVGVVNSKDTIYTFHVGIENLETDYPVSNNTLYPVESITKVFTATAIMQLVEQGKINLDDPAYTSLPFFQMKDTNYRKVTIRQLLDHTNGLPTLYKGFRGEPYFGDDAMKLYIKQLVARPFEFEPGTNFAYNNTGYVLLAAIIEEITSQRYEAYVTKNILTPIGMHHSVFLTPETSPSHKAALHVIGKDFQNTVFNRALTTRWIIGAGGLSSTVSDMCLFVQTQINRGIIDDQKILSPSSMDTMWKNNLGWNVYQVWGGTKLLDHGGSSIGCSAEIAFLPEDSLGVVVLCNNRNGAEWIIAKTILKTLLGKQTKKPKYYIQDSLQTMLREKGADSAIAYLKQQLNQHPDKISPFGVALLAYRIVQGGCTDTLPVAKQIFELLVNTYPDIPILYDMLGEVYFRLAVINYQKAVSLDPTLWGADETLQQLKQVTLDFY